METDERNSILQVNVGNMVHRSWPMHTASQSNATPESEDTDFDVAQGDRAHLPLLGASMVQLLPLALLSADVDCH